MLRYSIIPTFLLKISHGCHLYAVLCILLLFWYSRTPGECGKISMGWPEGLIRGAWRAKKMGQKGTKRQFSISEILWPYGVGSMVVRSEGVCTYVLRGCGRTTRGRLDVRAQRLWAVMHGMWTNRSMEMAQKVPWWAIFEPDLSSRLLLRANRVRMSKW